MFIYKKSPSHLRQWDKSYSVVGSRLYLVLERAHRLGIAVSANDAYRHAIKMASYLTSHADRCAKAAMGYGYIYSPDGLYDPSGEYSVWTESERKWQEDKQKSALDDIRLKCYTMAKSASKGSICYIAECYLCKSLVKVSQFHGDSPTTCKSCTMKMVHHERRTKELAEVKRLTHKLEKVISNENKRLAQKTTERN